MKLLAISSVFAIFSTTLITLPYPQPQARSTTTEIERYLSPRMGGAHHQETIAINTLLWLEFLRASISSCANGISTLVSGQHTTVTEGNVGIGASFYVEAIRGNTYSERGARNLKSNVESDTSLISKAARTPNVTQRAAPAPSTTLTSNLSLDEETTEDEKEKQKDNKVRALTMYLVLGGLAVITAIIAICARLYLKKKRSKRFARSQGVELSER